VKSSQVLRGFSGTQDMADQSRPRRRGPSIRRWLESWIWIYDLFGFIILSSILKYFTDWFEFFREWQDLVSPSRWAAYFSRNGLSPLLGVEIIAIFYLGKAFAKKNVDMLVSLFSGDRIPQDFQTDTREYTRLLVLNFAIFVFLESSIKLPWLASLGFAALSTFYLVWNRIQRDVVPNALNDPIYATRQDDPHARFIDQRRQAVSAYLFNRRHTLRESIVLVAGILGLGLSIAQRFCGFAYGDTLAYIVLITGVVLNEIIVGGWRRSLGRQLDIIDGDQMDDDMRRAEERRTPP
jgi:hypothetical protein